MVKQQGSEMQQAVIVSMSWICLGFILAEGMRLPDC